MKLTISGRAAKSAALCAVASRVFLGLVVDMPTTHNGAWLSALLGGLLAAPWLVCARTVRASRVAQSLLALYVVLDAASVLSALTRSAGYLALDRASPMLLALPAGVAVLWSVWRGGDAIGYASMIWVRIAALLLVALALLQWQYFRPEWLAPALGNGWTAIADGGIRAAGWIASASAVLAVPDPEGYPLSVLPPPMGGIWVCALLMTMAGMLTPTTLFGAWLNRLDDLLCNGRAPLYLQLPLIVLWFAGLLHLLVVQCFSAAALLQGSVGIRGRLCGLFVVAAVLVLSRQEALAALSVFISKWGFVAIGMVSALPVLFVEGGPPACEPRE